LNVVYGLPFALAAGAKITRRELSVTVVPAVVIAAPRVSPSAV